MTRPPVRTLPEMFERSVTALPRDAAMTHWGPGRQRRFSTEILRREVARVAAGLKALEVRRGDRVLLISENRPEWAICDYSTMFAGGILVPVYTSLTEPQLHYLLENSGARVAIASSQALLDKLLAAARGLHHLKQVVVVDQQAAAPEAMHLDSVAAMGDDLLQASPGCWREEGDRLREDDVATILYTSGTTGPPKGVMLSHRNIVSNIEALVQVLDFEPSDTALSFLPLCHITQRIADYCYFDRGARIVHVSLEDLPAALREVRPTTFPGVPRVFEKVRDAILIQAARRPAPARALFAWALRTGRAMARARLEGERPGAWLRARHAVGDRLALSRVRAGLGGRLRHVVCGGAPLNPAITEFFLSLGLPILEGYGLTEATIIAVNRPGRLRPGTVGSPVPGVEVRFEAARDDAGNGAGDGEVVVRGPGISRGYYLDVRRTEETFRDGWLHTGDLGRLDEAGHLVITGRKKELLVTSGGKKVSPALIEQQILSNQLVSQIVLVGDGRKYVSALVVPQRTRLLARCKEMGMGARAEAAYDRLLEDPRVRELYRQILEEGTRDLARFEKIKKFALLPSELTVEGGELTPTLKVRRRVVEEKYQGLIEAMYREG